MFLEIAAPAAHQQMAWSSKSHPEFLTIIDCRKCPCWSLSSIHLCLVFLLLEEKKRVSFLHCSDIAGSFSLGTLMKLALFSSSIGVLFQPPLKGTAFSSRSSSSSFQQALEDSVFSNHQDIIIAIPDLAISGCCVIDICSKRNRMRIVITVIKGHKFLGLIFGGVL